MDIFRKTLHGTEDTNGSRYGIVVRIGPVEVDVCTCMHSRIMSGNYRIFLGLWSSTVENFI